MVVTEHVRIEVALNGLAADNLQGHQQRLVIPKVIPPYADGSYSYLKPAKICAIS